MLNQDNYIQKKLEERITSNSFRELIVNSGLIDFCSNDYLGFAKEKSIHTVNDNIDLYGATGSRLISGNHVIIEQVESFLSDFYCSESALIFNSGYTANLGIFSCLAQRNDTIIYDELIHASVRDGIQLSNSNSFSFSHNDIISLEKKLKNAKGNIYVVIESVYSMDGDEAPIKEIIITCKKYNAAVIVDEAHATGIYGNGKGLVVDLGMENEVFARITTFGKAYGCHGAAILGSKKLRDFLINFSRPFIYTTALPLSSILSIRKAHEFLNQNLNRIDSLKENISFFKSSIDNDSLSIVNSNTAIQCIIIPKNDNVKHLAQKIQLQGFDVRPILSPTVPRGKERLRICLHSFNTKKEIEKLIALIPNN